LRGKTSNSRTVNFSADAGVAVGDFIPVLITEALPNSLRGSPATATTGARNPAEHTLSPPMD
jgi:hypothetical protein